MIVLDVELKRAMSNIATLPFSFPARNKLGFVVGVFAVVVVVVVDVVC